ncbi:hypothetical protein [Pseudomonas sp. NPDC089401]|uniref:hypothetical protein n=1 Tax=Pseudomonas sp. NPDC089401 TaxID=3364462 RepID=UPI0037FD50FC
MLTFSALRILAHEAPQDLMSWSRFVAQTEFVWQHPALVTDGEGWQALWFEMEILNALALAEWEQDGSPQDWSHRWGEGYEQDARALVPEMIALIVYPESSE